MLGKTRFKKHLLKKARFEKYVKESLDFLMPLSRQHETTVAFLVTVGLFRLYFSHSRLVCSRQFNVVVKHRISPAYIFAGLQNQLLNSSQL